MIGTYNGPGVTQINAIGPDTNAIAEYIKKGTLNVKISNTYQN